MNIKSLLVKALRELADKIEDGTCEASEDEMLDIFKLVTHEAMSKDRACAYLNMSRSCFDNWVRLGVIPRGRKRVGFKELVWYKDELDTVHFT